MSKIKHLPSRKFPGEYYSNTATKCYGSKIQALAIGMNTYCAVSVNKIHEFFMSVLKLPVSTGFIHNAVKKYAGKLDEPLAV